MSESVNVHAEPEPPRDPLRGPLRIAGALLLLGLVAFGVRCVKEGWWEPLPENPTKKQRRHWRRGTDFTAYHGAGELARQQKNIYDWRASTTHRRPYIYPPLFAVFPMAPLSLLNHNLALGVFYALNVALLLVSLALLRRLFWPPYIPAPPWTPFWQRPEVGLVLAVLACGRFFDSNFVLGQVNVIILFLLTLGLYLLRRERPLAGGLAVALATTYKVTPGLFGLYFLWSRRGKAMAGGAAGLLLFLLLLPSLWLGFGLNTKLLGGFAQHAVNKVQGVKPDRARGDLDHVIVGWGKRGTKDDAPDEAGGSKKNRDGEEDDELDQATGISLKGTLAKLLTESRAVDTKNREGDGSINIVALSDGAFSLLINGLSLLVLGLTVWYSASRWARADPWGTALSWGLVAVSMLLLSPLTRKAHAVVLLLPVAALIALLQQGKLSGSARRAAWAGVLITGGVCVLTSEDIVGETAGEYLHAFGAFTWAFCALFVCLMIVMRSLRAEADPEDKAAPAA